LICISFLAVGSINRRLTFIQLEINNLNPTNAPLTQLSSSHATPPPLLRSRSTVLPPHPFLWQPPTPLRSCVRWPCTSPHDCPARSQPPARQHGSGRLARPRPARQQPPRAAARVRPLNMPRRTHGSSVFRAQLFRDEALALRRRPVTSRRFPTAAKARLRPSPSPSTSRSHGGCSNAIRSRHSNSNRYALLFPFLFPYFFAADIQMRTGFVALYNFGARPRGCCGMTEPRPPRALQVTTAICSSVLACDLEGSSWLLA